MYRNFGNQGRGNPPYPTRETGSPLSGSSNPASLATISTQTTQQEQKFTMAGSSQFIPSLNAITTNQDLQWMVQPLVPTPGPSQSPRPPYPTLPGARPLTHSHLQPHLFRPGVIRAASHSVGSTRRRNDEHLSGEELERRRVRRERNKLAAAKCRNRRRELTDTLQSETDDLEGEKSRLQKEIAELEKQKDRLQLVLEAHRPICKIEESDSDSDHSSVLPSLRGVKMEQLDADLPGPSKRSQTKPEKPKPKITLPVKPTTSSASAAAGAESEALHTPVLMSTPSLTPFTASLIFTYPSGSLDTTASLLPMAAPASSSSQATSHQPRNPQPCGIAHRRSSSSGDQSDHSLHSPTILTL